MPKHIEVNNQTFTISGRIKGFTRREAAERVQAWGGKVRETVSRNVDYFVQGTGVGRGTTTKAYSAQYHDVPELSHDTFLTLLEEGEVWLDLDDHAMKEPHELNETLGLLRPWVQKRFDSGTWTHMMEILSVCDPDELENAVPYIERVVSSHTSNRDVAFNLFASLGPRSWWERCPALYFEPRLMPHAWVKGWAEGGVVSSAWRLARVFVPLSHKVPLASFRTLFESPNIRNLTQIYLPTFGCSATVLQRLCSSPHLANLQSIYLDSTPQISSLKKLQKMSLASANGIRILSLGSHHATNDKTLDFLFQTPLTNQVQTLTLSSGFRAVSSVARSLKSAACLPKLDTLVCPLNLYQDTPVVIGLPEQIKRLALTGGTPNASDALFNLGYIDQKMPLEELDLSRCAVRPKAIRPVLIRALKREWSLFSGLKRLRIPLAVYDENIAKAATKKGIKLSTKDAPIKPTF